MSETAYAVVSSTGHVQGAREDDLLGIGFEVYWDPTDALYASNDHPGSIVVPVTLTVNGIDTKEGFES